VLAALIEDIELWIGDLVEGVELGTFLSLEDGTDRLD
jgi:hypothetical protein